MKKPEITVSKDSLVITHRWFSFSYLILTVLVLITLVFVIFKSDYLSGFFSGLSLLLSDPSAFNDHMHELGPVSVFTHGMVYFVVCVIVFFVYYGLCRMINRTTISASLQTLTTKHGPLPWPLTSNARIAASCIKEFRIQKRVERTSTSAIPFYRVTARTDGKSKALTTYLEDDAPAKEIAATLNRFYKKTAAGQ